MEDEKMEVQKTHMERLPWT